MRHGMARVGVLAGMGLPLLMAGCSGLGLGDLLGFNSVEIEVFNDTDFPIDPQIKFDDDDGFFAGLFPADALTTGDLEPGEVIRFTFACEELGSVGSDSALQFFLLGDFEADDSNVLERGEEFDCGDRIEFRFIGEGAAFGVVVSVNGRIVD